MSLYKIQEIIILHQLNKYEISHRTKKKLPHLLQASKHPLMLSPVGAALNHSPHYALKFTHNAVCGPKSASSSWLWSWIAHIVPFVASSLRTLLLSHFYFFIFFFICRRVDKNGKPLN